ncbi:hypothetical protein Tco_0615617 [Tanacetum coccineum]
MIIAGADNRPPMLETSMYDSWKSHMELYIENRENGRIILNSVLNGPLVWLTIDEENGTTRTKKYEELLVAEKLQGDCDLKSTNIILQGLPPHVYAIVNHHKVTKEIWDKVKLLMQGTKLSLQEKECKLYDEFDKFSFMKDLIVPMFSQRDDPIACLNKAMAFLSTVAVSRVTVQQVQGRQGLSYAGTGYKGNATSFGGNNAGGRARAAQKTIPNTAAFQTEDLDAYDSDCDHVSNAKAVLMTNLFNYGSNVISELPYFEPYHNDMDNQSVHEMQETQKEVVQDTNLYAQQDSMVLSVIEQMYRICNKGQNKDKIGQNQAREWKEREKTSPTVSSDFIGSARNPLNGPGQPMLLLSPI